MLGMPWETKFNIETAIDDATNVFWAKGYKATSLNDLLSVMKINKGSFYNTFGSKQALFNRSLLKYDLTHRHQTLSNLRQLNNPVHAISQLFDLIIEQSVNDTERKGCFIINTAMDLPNLDDETASTVKNGIKQLELFFKEQIELGINNQSISKPLDSPQVAKALVALAAGCRILARGVFDEHDLATIKQQALALIK